MRARERSLIELGGEFGDEVFVHFAFRQDRLIGP